MRILVLFGEEMPVGTRTISTKIAIEGEAEYRQKITSCNTELKAHKSALALVESEYRNNANSMEALTERGAALDSIYKKQQEKVSTLEAALRNAQRAQEEYASRVSTAQSNIERCEQALEKLRSSTEGTSEEQAALTAELERWNDELSEAEAGQAAAERGVQSWQEKLNKAKIEQNELSDAVQKNDTYLEEAKKSVDGCATSIDEYGKEVKEAGDNSKEFGERSKSAVEGLAQALVAAGLASKVQDVAKAIYECVDTFAAFESQMSTVQAISGATSEEMVQLTEKAKYMGATTAFTATEAGQALEYMAMAGWKTEDMLNGLEGIMYLAAASGEDLAEVSDIVTDALTAFGLAASDSGHFADVLAKASSNSNTNVHLMGETFKYVAPLAGALGYSIEDTAVAIGLMANAGVKGSQAGTALRGILTNLAKPSDTVAMYMERLGVSLTDNSGRMRSLSELIGILRDRFEDLTEAERSEYAAGIAGKEAMSGLLDIVNASEEDFQKLTEAINNCNGAAHEMAQMRLDNYAGQVTLLESAVDGLKTTLGSQLAPVLGAIAEGATSVVGGLNQLLETCPAISAVLAGLITAAGLLIVAFAGFSILETITPAIHAFNAALAANPAGIVAIAIAGVVAALGTLVAGCSGASGEVGKLKQELQEIEGSYQRTAKETYATAAAAEQLINKLAILEAQESMTEGEAALYAQTVDKLRALMPELNIELDEQTKLLVGGAEALRMSTQAWKDRALAQALQEKYQSLLDGQAQALIVVAERQLEYNDALATYTDIERQMQEIGEAMNQVTADSTLTLEEKEARLAELNLQMTLLTEQQMTASSELDRYSGELDKAKSAAEAFDVELEHLTETENILTGANQASSDSVQLMEATVSSLVSEMEELQAAYDESYSKAVENIEGQLGLFNKLDGSAKTSIQDLIGSLKGQVSYMETYAANIKKAMEMGVDEGLIRKLSDGSEKSAQILAAIVAGGEKDVAELNAQLAKVEEGKGAFGDAVASMEVDFNEQMKRILGDLDSAMRDMDLKDDMYKVGADNIQGLINGTDAKKRDLVNKYAEMGRAALAAYKREVAQASPSKKFKEVGHYDIQGIIGGVEEEKTHLAAAYEDMARTALNSMRKGMPSMVIEPSASAAIDQQTAAIVSAVSTWSGDGASPIQIYVDKLEVRDDLDVDRVAQQLYYLKTQESRSRGGGIL